MQDEQDENTFLKNRLAKLEEELNLLKEKEKKYLSQISRLQEEVTANKTVPSSTETSFHTRQENYSHFFAHAPLGIFRSTVDGRFLEVNIALARMLGYDTPEEVIDNITDIGTQVYVKTEKRQKIIDYSQKTSGVQRFENVYRRLDGSQFTANLYLKVIKNHKGETEYLEGMLEDISYRKKYEKAIKENEKRLIKLNTILNEAESMSEIGSYEWNIKTNISLFSKGWQDIHGFFENKIPFEKIKKICHPDDLDYVLNEIEQALKGIKDFNVVHRIIRQNDRKVRHIKSKAKIIFNAKKEPSLMYGSVQDITEQVHGKQALEESEKKYRFLADSTSELICLQDTDGTYLHVSPSVNRMLGYNPDELIGTNAYKMFHPDDLEKIRTESHAKALQGTPVKNLEYRIRKKNGTYIWFDTNTDVIFNESGEVKSLITRSRDITERITYQQKLKTSEEQLKIALNGAVADSWELNLQKNELTYSEKWISRLGYSSNELTFNVDHIKQIIHEDDLKASLNKLQDHIEGKSPYYESEARVKKKNGRFIWILSRGIIVERDNKGHPLRLLGINFDITRLKKVEKALHESEERFRAAFEQDNSVKLIIAPESGKILEANKAAEKFYGRSHHEMIQMNIHDMNPLSESALTKEMESAVEKKQNHFYFKHIIKNGEIRDVEVYLTPIEYGGSTRLLSIIYDVTDRLKVQQALEVSETRLKQAEKAGKLGHFEIDVATGKAKWSDEIFRILALPPDEFEPSLASFEKMIHLEDKQKVIDHLIEVTQQHLEFDLEYRIIQKNGQTRYVHSKGYLEYDENNEPLTMFGTLQDITDRWLAQQALRESEERYRKLITGMNDGVILYNHDGKNISSNPAALSILGLKQEELSYLSTESKFFTYLKENGSVIPNEEHPALLTLSTGKPVHQVIMGIKKPTEEIKWISINSDVLYLSENTRPFAMVTFSDISRIKKSEQELRELNATKDKFFSIIAHDLLNPFNSLLGFSILLITKLNNNKTEKIDYLAKLIHQSAQQGYILLKNLLEWSRSQTGKIIYNPERVNLSEMINEIFQLHHFNAERKNIILNFTTDQNTIVYADSNMLHTILRNLISNALKYTGQNGTVSVHSKKLDKYVEISVQDTGIGMDEKMINNLFQIGNQFTTKGTDDEKGTGLGLIICKDFIERHGGTLKIKSKKGMGSTFSFTIPAKTG